MRSSILLTLCLPLSAQWMPLGPFGGSASVVVADPHSPKTFLAGTRNALLFRTRDAGDSWTPMPFPAQFQATLNTLAVDPKTPGTYLAALSSDLPQFSGIFRSTDAGATWRQIPALRGQQVRAIAFKRADSRIFAAGTDSGVFVTENGGTEWRRMSPEDNPQLRPIVALTFDPNDASTIYAGTPHLPWKTSDYGLNWTSVHSGMLDDSDIFSVQVDRNRPQRVVAAACSGIYRSVNGGLAWTRPVDSKPASDRTYVVAQDEQFENTWFAGTAHGFVRSTNGGATWQKLADFATRSIAFDPGRLDRILIATDEDGLQRSEDGGRTWRPVNRGFCNRRLSALRISRNAVYADMPDGRELELDAWTAAAGELDPAVPTGPRTPLGNDTIQAMCRHPRRPRQLYVAKFGVIYSSADSGRTWQAISPETWPIRSVTQLLVVTGTPDRLLVLTPQQGVWELNLDR